MQVQHHLPRIPLPRTDADKTHHSSTTGKADERQHPPSFRMWRAVLGCACWTFPTAGKTSQFETFLQCLTFLYCLLLPGISWIKKEQMPMHHVCTFTSLHVYYMFKRTSNKIQWILEHPKLLSLSNKQYSITMATQVLTCCKIGIESLFEASIKVTLRKARTVSF